MFGIGNTYMPQVNARVPQVRAYRSGEPRRHPQIKIKHRNAYGVGLADQLAWLIIARPAAWVAAVWGRGVEPGNFLVSRIAIDNFIAHPPSFRV